MFMWSAPPSPPRPPKCVAKDQPTPPKAPLNDPLTPKIMELPMDNNGGQTQWFVQYIWGLSARYRFNISDPNAQPPCNMEARGSDTPIPFSVIQQGAGCINRRYN